MVYWYDVWIPSISESACFIASHTHYAHAFSWCLWSGDVQVKLFHIDSGSSNKDPSVDIPLKWVSRGTPLNCSSHDQVKC